MSTDMYFFWQYIFYYYYNNDVDGDDGGNDDDDDDEEVSERYLSSTVLRARGQLGCSPGFWKKNTQKEHYIYPPDFTCHMNILQPKTDCFIRSISPSFSNYHALSNYQPIGFLSIFPQS